MDKALIRVYECDPVTADAEFLLSKAKVSGDIRQGAEARRLRRRLPRGHQSITGELYQPVVAAVCSAATARKSSCNEIRQTPIPSSHINYEKEINA